ncbi:anoctamin-7 [Ixodes scapularis]
MSGRKSLGVTINEAHDSHSSIADDTAVCDGVLEGPVRGSFDDRPCGDVEQRASPSVHLRRSGSMAPPNGPDRREARSVPKPDPWKEGPNAKRQVLGGDVPVGHGGALQGHPAFVQAEDVRRQCPQGRSRHSGQPQPGSSYVFSFTARTLSAPFQCKCMDWFIGVRDKASYFRSALRCLLTHHVLTNIDIAKSENENPVEFHRKKGLSYLLMKNVYLDAFVMHDRSVLEPVYVPGEPTSTVTGQSLSALKVTDSVNHLDDRQRDRDYGSGRTVKDTRTSLDSHWRKLMGGQPLDSIRDYFGEKISFYFAWVGTFIASLVVPAVIGLGVFFFGVIEKDVNAIIYTVDVIKAAGDTFLTPFFAFTVCLWGNLWGKWRMGSTTHHVLTNIDIAKSENENPVEFHRKKGLSYLLMKNVYLDAFVMHDRSVLEPVYVPGEPTSTVTGQSLSALKVTDSVNHLDDRQRDRDYGSGRTVKDTRTSLDSHWRKLMGGQPLDSIRDYFGEKISFYFAWVGTFIASLVVPAVIGLGVFFFGVIEK